MPDDDYFKAALYLDRKLSLTDIINHNYVVHDITRDDVARMKAEENEAYNDKPCSLYDIIEG